MLVTAKGGGILMKNIYITQEFEPRCILKHFENICSIPHCSGNEAELAAYIESYAKERDLITKMDDRGNLFIRVPASKGYGDVAPLLMQGHMDMVCVKKEGVNTDMLKESVNLVLDGSLLRADGTTLGSDNAVGICFMMQLMDDNELIHPPLELLFTVEEEIGMNGILGFDMSQIKARRMITMDCGKPDVMVRGSAGISKFIVNSKYKETSFNGKVLTIDLGGLKGGHTGSRIGKNQGSAIDFVGRLLSALAMKIPVQLISISTPHGNVTSLPRHCTMTIGVQNKDMLEFSQIFMDMSNDFKSEIHNIEHDFYINVKESTSDTALNIDDTKAIADFLLLVPYDMFRVSNDEYNMPRSSAVLSILKYYKGSLSANISMRANLDAYMNNSIAKLETLCNLFCIKLIMQNRVPAWPIKSNSKLSALCQKVYTELYGKPMNEVVIHGAIEASVIFNSIKDMDIVGFAPLAYGAHTIEEHLYLDTMQPFWEFLKNVIKAMCSYNI